MKEDLVLIEAFLLYRSKLLKITLGSFDLTTNKISTWKSF